MPNSVWRESLSRSILDLVEDKANIGSWSWDLQTGEVNWSVGVYRIFSVSPEDRPGLQLIESSIEGSDATALRSSNPLVAARFLADRKFNIRRRDGEVRTIHSHGKLVTAGRDGTTQFVGAFLDITDSRLEDELFLLREALLDSMRQLFEVAIWQADEDGAVSDPLQWRMALGKDAGPDGPWGRLDLVHPEDREEVKRAWSEAHDNKKIYSSSFRLLVDGDYVAAQSKAVSLLDGAGKLLGWIGFTRVLDGPETSRTQTGSLSAAQIRAARGLLDWSGRDLAAKAGVSFSSVRRAEAQSVTNVTHATMLAIQSAFEKEGVRFTLNEDGQRGVAFD